MTAKVADFTVRSKYPDIVIRGNDNNVYLCTAGCPLKHSWAGRINKTVEGFGRLQPRKKIAKEAVTLIKFFIAVFNHAKIHPFF